MGRICRLVCPKFGTTLYSSTRMAGLLTEFQGSALSRKVPGGRVDSALG